MQVIVLFKCPKIIFFTNNQFDIFFKKTLFSHRQLTMISAITEIND